MSYKNNKMFLFNPQDSFCVRDSSDLNTSSSRPKKRKRIICLGSTDSSNSSN